LNARYRRSQFFGAQAADHQDIGCIDRHLRQLRTSQRQTQAKGLAEYRSAIEFVFWSNQEPLQRAAPFVTP
jgi:hypothetical protein